MDDTSDQTPVLSYVDNYTPPTQSNLSDPLAKPGVISNQSLPPVSPSLSVASLATPPASDSFRAQPLTTQPSFSHSPAVSPMPQAPSSPTPATPPAAPAPTPVSTTTDTPKGQSLEEQNIFEMLGAAQATEPEKESFLDELQQVIWEDFLENDVELLITEAEKTELKQLQTKVYPSDLEKQEAIVVYLEKLIPDLEDIMLEKALELKRDMFMERINGMKDFFAQQPAKLDTIAQVESLVSQDKWREAVDSLNQLT